MEALRTIGDTKKKFGLRNLATISYEVSEISSARKFLMNQSICSGKVSPEVVITMLQLAEFTRTQFQFESEELKFLTGRFFRPRLRSIYLNFPDANVFKD